MHCTVAAPPDQIRPHLLVIEVVALYVYLPDLESREHWEISINGRAYSFLHCILYIYYTTTWLHEHTTTLRRTY